jgi:hypothetical protein
MRVLVACETSGMVRRAFASLGHDAWSCDLLPSDDRHNKHIQADVRSVLSDGWDLLMVAHPPCTRLCNSGVRWLHVPPKGKTLQQMWDDLDEGAALFSDCWNAPIERLCVENPVMHSHARQRIRSYEPPAQTVQPWWFGERAFKATSLYLRGLAPLQPTNRLTPPAKGTEEHKQWSFIHRMSKSPDRWKKRSQTFPGVAYAMAMQWGSGP